MPYKDPERQKRYFADYRKAHREEKRQYLKRLYHSKPEHFRRYQVLKKFRNYDEMFGWEPGTAERIYNEAVACALCREPFEDVHGRKKVMDHDHSNDKFRGVLHDNCNKGIGLLGDSVEGLRRALRYLGFEEAE